MTEAAIAILYTIVPFTIMFIIVLITRHELNKKIDDLKRELKKMKEKQNKEP
jgi:uncharacterized protein YoxC